MNKYTLTIEGDFEKGECKSCPVRYFTFNKNGEREEWCPVHAFDCPLEEATVAKNATTEGEWIMETRYTYMPIEYKEGVLVEHPYTMYICSKCGREELKAELYCHCGAKMKGCK